MLRNAIQCHSRWKIQERRQIRKQDTLQKLNTTQKKANNAKYSRTKLAWFSRLIRHSARKRRGLILRSSRAHTGHGYCNQTRILKVSVVFWGIQCTANYTVFIRWIQTQRQSVVNPTKGRGLSRVDLGIMIGLTRPQTVIYPSTKWAWRTATTSDRDKSR